MEGATILLKFNLGGVSNVGKTSFIAREIQDKFYPDYHYNTIGLDFFTKDLSVGEQKVKMQLWDISGADRIMRFRKPQFRKSQAVLLCFALNDPYSFQDIPQWLKGVREFELDCPIYLVGCKCDLQQTVPEEEIARFVEEEGLVYFKCSAKEDIGIKDNLQKIIEKLVAEILKSPEKFNKAKIVPPAQSA